MSVSPTAPGSDVLILGSGAAGLTAALTALCHGLSVQILEATPLIGGATAYSEGMAWVPASPQAVALGLIPDAMAERRAALAYLAATCGADLDHARAEAYVTHAAAMLSHLQAESPLRFRLNRGSMDYVPEAAGASRGLRALNPLPFDARILGRSLFARLRPPLETMMLFGGHAFDSAEVPDLLASGRDPRAALRTAGRIARHLGHRLAGWPRGPRSANGGAIIAALTHAVSRRGGRILLEAPVTELLREQRSRGGRVTGLRLQDGRVLTAAAGIVLAGGSLTADPEARRRHLGHEAAHLSLPPPSGPGAVDLALAIGAGQARPPAQPVLWTPASMVPLGDGQQVPWPHFGDRAKPGVIIVGPDGRRFANEAMVYHDFVPRLLQVHARAEGGPHAWLIADHRALRRHGLGPVGPFPALLGPWLRRGYLRCAATPKALAEALGLPPEVLAETLHRFNAGARLGQDPEHGRGASAYDRNNGDPHHAPNPALGPLEKPPFYAIRVQPGDIGGFIGVASDARARVLDQAAEPIPGLYAAGNAAAPPTGGHYPAAGLTIGAAMTFGYIAALEILASLRQQALPAAAE